MKSRKAMAIILLSFLLIFGNVTSAPALALALNPAQGMVSPGVLHTLYVNNRQLYAWGDNTFGELGDGSRITRLMPVKIPFDKGVISSVSAGLGFSLILTTDGKLWFFGLTMSPDNPYQTTPVEVLDSVKAISAGTDFALALKDDGTVWAWGNNTRGQLGDGSSEQRLSYIQVPNLTGITQISAGADHSMALDQNGKVWTWGANTYGQLGTGDSTDRNTPFQVTQLSNIKQVSAGYEYSLTLNTSGKAYAWGKNDVGQLGVGKNTYQPEKTPVPVCLNNDTLLSIEAGSSNSFAKDYANDLCAWGDNRTYLIRDANHDYYKDYFDYPVEIYVPYEDSVAAGFNNAFVVTSFGLVAHGSNFTGQLGDGTMLYSYSFYDVLLDQNISAAHRLGGNNRFETAVKISNSGWPYGLLPSMLPDIGFPDGYGTSVVLARADSFPDALSGTPLAAGLAAPILLTNKNTLSPETAAEIERLGPKTIYLLGGEGAISKNISNQLKNDGYTVIRLGGTDRFDTSYKIAQYLYDHKLTSGEKAVVCNGLNYPDALSVSSAAGYQRMPILLTMPNKLSPPAQTAITELGVKKTFVIGGTGVVSDGILLQLPDAVRYGGADRYDTSLQVAKNMGMDTGTVFLASGKNFPDALAGSVLAAFTNSPVILVGNNPPNLEKYNTILNQLTRNIYVLGGDSVINDDLLFSMEDKYFAYIDVYYEI
ncbi:cell wall-binding repeat-containing protein [Dehalobacter sp. DCM]|uniref:RCC1 domain-containing protein n=1 Tax=Dehalobacter sp. DCM TaxID=2907827 RepID=UPI003081F7A3|nr:cell wall-binding repeat-containing protein [Dehalobacter sp. DCM]